MANARPTIETRRDQMFPTLEPAEVDRLRRFGEVTRFEDGEALLVNGRPASRFVVILSGAVRVTQQDQMGHRLEIVTHEAGAFMGEVAQLSGAPSLVDAHAVGPVEALLLAPDRLRAVLIAEAELGERIMRALILRRVALLESGSGGPVIIGHDGSGDVIRLLSFLDRNGVPRHLMDPNVDADAQTLIQRLHVDAAELPIVLCPGGELLRNPSESQLARCLGMVGPVDPDRLYDVAIVGAGPAGLAAAVYAASEGLSVLMFDARAFGGQAGASARIENYLGFPTGIRGMALMGRAYNQAHKFGAETAIPDTVARLSDAAPGAQGPYSLVLDTGEAVQARSVVIASGARYRRLNLPNLDAFEGSSVHYWASPLEAQLCKDQEVALVGAGNSAGQAVVYLASHVAKVWLLCRGRDIADSMSRYLVDRIRGLPNVEVLTETEVTALDGEDGNLATVAWRHRRTGEAARRDIRHLFLFIGAQPNTDWLSDCAVGVDAKGFVRTGAEAGAGRGVLETSREGVFAIGDVRAGSVKRVAAAVGEGAQVVAAVHAFLASRDPMAAQPPHT
ncbi:FAD-dependent oxidoreductase [Caulobacter sp. KR2-114]|uniref:FAD-dependent oxidoreductase n=1 Tax=Caulobacter sp. KR2-114 TaxID=3400912 RepID=UPI003C07FA17